MKLIPFALLTGTTAWMVGCASLSVHQSPMTVPVGESDFATGVTMLHPRSTVSEDCGASTDCVGSKGDSGPFRNESVTATYYAPFVSYRRGFSSRVDAGIKIAFPATLATDVKLRLGDSTFAIAPVLGASFTAFRDQYLTTVNPALIVGNASVYLAYHPSMVFGLEDPLLVQAASVGYVTKGPNVRFNPEIGLIQYHGRPGMYIAPSLGIHIRL